MTPKVLRVAVVDDEPVARRILIRLLEGEAGIEIVGEAGNGEEAIALLLREEVDVAFLDIQMPEIGGFRVLEALPDNAVPDVVFVTAYDEHAIRAFEIGAIDYLLKPFDDARFRTTLDRIRYRARQQHRADPRSVLREIAEELWKAGDPVEASPLPDPGGERIAVRSGKRIEFVAVADIEWIEAENYYVRIHTDARSYLLRESLTRLEERLGGGDFVRVHRSAILRIGRIRELRAADDGHYDAVLSSGERVRVSRSRRGQLFRALGVDPDG